MPLIDIEVIEGVFDDATLAEMIDKVTETMVEIQGEAMRPVTWVRVFEVRNGHWALGGKRPNFGQNKAAVAS